MNWTGSWARQWLYMGRRKELAWMSLELNSSNAILVVVREGQVNRKDSTVPL